MIRSEVEDGVATLTIDRPEKGNVAGPERGLRGRADESERWWPLVACPKPVIAAVDGVAVGMGAEFTSQCDARFTGR